LKSGTQLCTSYINQVQLVNCDQIVNGTSQCRLQFVEFPLYPSQTKVYFL